MVGIKLILTFVDEKKGTFKFVTPSSPLSPIHQTFTGYFLFACFLYIKVRVYINIWKELFTLHTSHLLSFSTLQTFQLSLRQLRKKHRTCKDLYQEIYYLWYGLLNK